MNISEYEYLWDKNKAVNILKDLVLMVSSLRVQFQQLVQMFCCLMSMRILEFMM